LEIGLEAKVLIIPSIVLGRFGTLNIDNKGVLENEYGYVVKGRIKMLSLTGHFVLEGTVMLPLN